MIIETNKNAYFMPKSAAIVDSLFMGKTETARGYYKKRKHITEFYDHQDKLRAALVHNQHNKFNECFFVTATIINGKKFFMYALTELDKKFLGLNELGYRQEIELAENIAKQILRDI